MKNNNYDNSGYTRRNGYQSKAQSSNLTANSRKWNSGGWTPATKEHDDQVMRQYAYNKTFITPDGEYAESADGAEILIRSREDGAKYININGKPQWLDYMVASCFCHKPKDGKHYIVNHKDGDIGNCDKSNLEWIEDSINDDKDGIQIIDSRINPFRDEL